MQTLNNNGSSPATTSAARQSGCEAPAWQARMSSAERSDAGLVGFKKQSDPSTIRINHSDSHRKRLNKMRLVVKGAAWGIQNTLTTGGFPVTIARCSWDRHLRPKTGQLVPEPYPRFDAALSTLVQTSLRAVQMRLGGRTSQGWKGSLSLCVLGA